MSLPSEHAVPSANACQAMVHTLRHLFHVQRDLFVEEDPIASDQREAEASQPAGYAVCCLGRWLRLIREPQGELGRFHKERC
jgi:hypothetical protein